MTACISLLTAWYNFPKIHKRNSQPSSPVRSSEILHSEINIPLCLLMEWFWFLLCVCCLCLFVLVREEANKGPNMYYLEFKSDTVQMLEILGNGTSKKSPGQMAIAPLSIKGSFSTQVDSHSEATARKQFLVKKHLLPCKGSKINQTKSPLDGAQHGAEPRQVTSCNVGP